MSRLSRVPPPTPTALGLRQGDKRPGHALSTPLMCSSRSVTTCSGGPSHDQESPIAIGGRGLPRGRIYDVHGQLLVSVVQEGLFRSL